MKPRTIRRFVSAAVLLSAMVADVPFPGLNVVNAEPVSIRYFGNVTQIHVGRDLLGESVQVGTQVTGVITIDPDPSLWTRYEPAKGEFQARESAAMWATVSAGVYSWDFGNDGGCDVYLFNDETFTPPNPSPVDRLYYSIDDGARGTHLKLDLEDHSPADALLPSDYPISPAWVPNASDWQVDYALRVRIDPHVNFQVTITEFHLVSEASILASRADGYWNAAGTWNDGDMVIPTADNPVVVSGHLVTVAENASAASLTISEANGSVDIQPGSDLWVIDDVEIEGGRLIVGGSLNAMAVEVIGGTFDLQGDVNAPTVEVVSGALLIQGTLNANDVTISESTLSIAAGGMLDVDHQLTMEGDSPYVWQLSEQTPGLIASSGDVFIHHGSTMVFDVNGASMFKAGTYTLIESAGPIGFIGSFGLASGLGAYASGGLGGDGLTYSREQLTLTVDKDLNPGDADLSTQTDLSDFNIWNANKFTADTGWTTGDFNGDGVTDLSDFNIWNAHKFTTATGGAAPAPVEVPEPGTLGLLGVAVVVGLAWRRRVGRYGLGTTDERG